MFVVYHPLMKIVGFSLGVFKYVVCFCKGCCVFCLYCEAWSCRAFCYADVVCLCLVYILWQFSMLRSA